MRTVALCDDNDKQLAQAAEALRMYADDAGLDMQIEQYDAIDRERRAVIAVSPIGEDALVSVVCDDVRYLERRLRVTHFFLRDGTELSVREKLSELSEKLPELSFGRCHNSYIINLPCVKRLRSADLDLEDGTSLPVSRSHSKRFRQKHLRWLESTSV